MSNEVDELSLTREEIEEIRTDNPRCAIAIESLQALSFDAIAQENDRPSEGQRWITDTDIRDGQRLEARFNTLQQRQMYGMLTKAEKAEYERLGEFRYSESPEFEIRVEIPEPLEYQGVHEDLSRLAPLGLITEDMLEERLWQLDVRLKYALENDNDDMLLSAEELDEHKWLSERPHNKHLRRQLGARRWADENFDEVFANGDDDELRALQRQLEMAELDEEMAEIQRYNDSLT